MHSYSTRAVYSQVKTGSMNTGPGYNLIRSKKRKKTISLCIQKNGTIVIHAPCNTPGDEIDKFFSNKKNK